MKETEQVEDNYVSIIFVSWAMNENRSWLAKASLKSLENTIHSSSEIIVVDNGGSLEDSKFFLEECDKKGITLYIRNADNMHFGFARNQGLINSTANWVAIVDNDIMYKDKWLEMCLMMLKAHPDKKLIASPINYPHVHSRDPRWKHGTLRVKSRMCNVHERAGSNCMVMRKEVFDEVGFFRLHRISGSYFTDDLIRKGYLVITPEVNWAYDCGLRLGYKRNDLPFQRTLSDGEVVKFSTFPIWK